MFNIVFSLFVNNQISFVLYLVIHSMDYSYAFFVVDRHNKLIVINIFVMHAVSKCLIN